MIRTKHAKKESTKANECPLTDKTLHQTEMLAMLGVPDEDIALFFNIDNGTLKYWKENYPEFREAIKRGGVYAVGGTKPF